MTKEPCKDTYYDTLTHPNRTNYSCSGPTHLKSLQLSSSLNDRLIRFLTSQKVPHFLIFHAHVEESAGSVANGFLLDWLQVVPPLQTHVDLLTLMPEGKLSLHTVAKVGALLEELSLAPYSGGRRAVLIRHMDRMLPSSSNALLKALEEPLCQTVFIGTTEKPHRLLPTIRSRAHEIAIPAMETKARHFEVVESALTLVMTKIPLVSFTALFSLCDELVELLEKKLKECKKVGGKSIDEETFQFVLEELASDCIRAFVSSIQATLPLEKKKVLLISGQEALDALDKHTSVRDVFVIFFCVLIRPS